MRMDGRRSNHGLEIEAFVELLLDQGGRTGRQRILAMIPF